MTEKLPPLPMYTNDELDVFLLERGGLFWLDEEHTDSIRQMFQSIVARFKRNLSYACTELYREKPRPVEFGFTCESDLNAFAYASPEGATPQFDFIGINIGVLFTLMDVFTRMLAHPDIFPDVGNPKIEDGSINSIPFLSTDIFKSEFQPLFPKCPVRANFAFELSKVALDFLFFHELAHLSSGHLEFVRNHLFEKQLSEVFSNSLATDRNMVRQTLEIDADCGAALLTLANAFTLKDQVTPSITLSSDVAAGVLTAAYGSTSRAIRMVSFSTYVIFRLFDTPEWFSDLQSAYKHPFPPIRMFFIGPTIYEIFRTRSEFGYDADLFIREHAEHIKDVEIACGLIKGEQPDVRGLSSVITNPQTSDYIRNFKTHWQEIRPILEKYKRGGNLPE